MSSMSILMPARLPQEAKIYQIPHVHTKRIQPKVLTQRKRELIRCGAIPATKGIVLPPMRKGA